MNEEHIIAAILTAGLVSKDSGETTPKDAVDLYQLTLTELVASSRPTRGSED